MHCSPWRVKYACKEATADPLHGWRVQPGGKYTVYRQKPGAPVREILAEVPMRRSVPCWVRRHSTLSTSGSVWRVHFLAMSCQGQQLWDTVAAWLQFL